MEGGGIERVGRRRYREGWKEGIQRGLEGGDIERVGRRGYRKVWKKGI